MLAEKIMNLQLISLILMFAPFVSLAQTTGKQDYINKFQNIAVAQMKKSGVPASIILGQACLESGYGKSRLAVEGKNHFGIKCHNSWNGAKIYHDDDAQGECFRKYKADEESFQDHSDFLRYNKRYATLFDLNPNDYKSWAQGLKKAGYATDPKYAELLIGVIESNRLYLFDAKISPEIPSPSALEIMESENFLIQLNRRIYSRNGVKYVKINEGESFAQIASEFKLSERQLLKYNELQKYDRPVAGQELYIKKKKTRADYKTPVHIAQENESMRAISQRYAVKLKSLLHYNNMKENDRPVAGQEIYLRNKMRR
ncbi:MAG: glucosaminidase domain-containing protein [Prevotellaceae bacterium]|nr:glucosaminidase domain-containing protein [Prevotellaceae bacterium]